MQITNIQLYGAAGGESRTGRFNVTIEASDVDTCAEAKTLIAAAPDLLAALEKFANLDRTVNSDLWAIVPEFCEQARAAIAKARG